MKNKLTKEQKLYLTLNSIKHDIIGNIIYFIAILSVPLYIIVKLINFDMILLVFNIIMLILCINIILNSLINFAITVVAFSIERKQK